MKQKTIFFILLIALILRLLLLIYFWDKPLTIVDEMHYNKIAENIVTDHQFALLKNQPTAIRPPLYPFFLSAIYFLTGGIYLNVVRVVQIFISLAIVWMIYLLGKKLYEEKVGLLGAFLFAAYPSFLFFTHFILTEVLFTLLLLLFVWFLFSFQESKKKMDIWLAGLFLGIGALTRSILYPFLIPAIIYLFFSCKTHIYKRIQFMILFALGYAMIISPWTIRNYLLLNDLVVVGTMGGLNLHMGNYEHTPLNRSWAAVDIKGEKSWYYGYEKTLTPMNEAQKQKWALQKAKNYILTHKLLTIKRDLIKAANFWGLERAIIGGILAGHYPGLDKKGLLIPITIAIFLTYMAVAIGSVFGMVYYFEENQKKIFAFFTTLLVLYFTGMHSLVFGHSRYHLPLISIMVIFAAWSLFSALKIWDSRQTWKFKISVILSSIFLIIWVRDVLIDASRFIGSV